MEYFKRYLKLIMMVSTLLMGKSSLNKTENTEISVYGYIRSEMIFDNTHIAKGDWLLYIPQGNDKSDDKSAFTMTSRHTRMGMKLNKPVVSSSTQISGLIEIDFAGGFPNSSTAARQPILRLRHAWIEMKKNKLSIRFGQDWALIAGPFPSTTSFVVGAGKGNLWMRYPQLKTTWESGNIKWAGSINRPIAGNVKYEDSSGGDFDPVGDGEITGQPWFMSRVWIKTALGLVSTSGHFGKESIADLSTNQHEVQSWSVNADIVTKWDHFSFTARYFKGENLNSFFGGIFQGFTKDSTSVTSLPSFGGWAQVTYNMNDFISVTGGYGTDNPDDSSLPDGARINNEWFFTNLSYQISPSVKVIFEFDNLITSYKNADNSSGNRFHLIGYLTF